MGVCSLGRTFVISPSLLYTEWGDVGTRQVLIHASVQNSASEVFSPSCRWAGMRPDIDIVAARYASGRIAANAPPMEGQFGVYSVSLSDVMGARGVGF